MASPVLVAAVSPLAALPSLAAVPMARPSVLTARVATAADDAAAAVST